MFKDAIFASPKPPISYEIMRWKVQMRIMSALPSIHTRDCEGFESGSRIEHSSRSLLYARYYKPVF